ncbi:DNA-directed RNA polymerase subunit beta' [Heliophilum fasciatum]|uniref:DNA-directed RNA polymerase subunit beta' n=1 Tax=Heliophilum fasciatum TaxID=35700 RepID=A0A4R2RNN3_9FIRM|nr:DNA-directed RNA polymerase subunit beta' [Heliophilum fasciatum]MCW2277823.1 DNA-directed RNA polymerase subunit beta' [Heliophilum fasciatum]TCP64684.1 DNA-directed RNA polymerase subunit beta' [Heliophilum fasciatum]
MLDVNNFDRMRIGLASPDLIMKWSSGEVKKPETINYRTLKPERDGLFCERIFGPTRDWECHCGKYKRIRYKGIVCDRCGVEVTRSKVRRERLGHIKLAAPVSHIWYFKGIPSRMGLLLDMSPRSLEKVLYFVSYIVIEPGETSLMKKQLLTEAEYREYREKFGAEFRAGMGAEAIKELLVEMDLEQLCNELRKELREVTGQRKVRAIRRLEVVEAFKHSGNRPDWMIMDVVPVIPPELRPMVQLDGGRFATSDLNDLYRRVINRNNRLKRLLDLGAPDIIVRNEKRMLQEAVDALIDNGRRGRPVTGPGNRPLKSLSDMLKGKQGRFRQNLLGKRVDYSGRSVIVVGPEMQLHQCGLPKEMALELFKPFVMKKLVEDGHAHNIKSAKRMVERVKNEVWDVLEGVIAEHPVLLNRAPTLHRLGIQAFEPILVEGRALQIHPLVCTAYNADFDGDQMAVHVPLSAEAQAEARNLMLSAHNILNPKDGRPVAVPTQDMVIGSFYLTCDRKNAKGEGMIFANIDEVLMAYECGVIHLQAEIEVLMDDALREAVSYAHPSSQIFDASGKRLITTCGRLIFNQEIPAKVGYVNEVVGKKQLGNIVARCYEKLGIGVAAKMLDGIKRQGFKYSTRAGVTVGITDIDVPEEKVTLLAEADREVEMIERNYRKGLITADERYDQVIKVWSRTTEDVKDALLKTLDKFNPVYMMATSGARGNIQQIRQLAGMRGLMADPSGRIIDLPIKANFREGLTVLEYFISTHGARKGLADTALRTADSGYLTRRLVDVSQDVIVREIDCYSNSGMSVQSIYSDKQLVERIKDRLAGRYPLEELVDWHALDQALTNGSAVDTTNPEWQQDFRLTTLDEEISNDLAERVDNLIYHNYVNRNQPSELFIRRATQQVVDPETGEVLVSIGDVLTLDQFLQARAFAGDTPWYQDEERNHVHIRTTLTCRTRHGVCRKCYGRNLATGQSVEIGEAVGIIAAQSIGEPGTQLTMRTFHTGGVAGDDITQGLPRVEELFEACKPKGLAIIAEHDGIIHFIETKGRREIEIIDDEGERHHYPIPYNYRFKKEIVEGKRVQAGDEMTEGSVNPHDLLRVKGMIGVQNYLLAQVQGVYRLQGVDINDKHIEVMVRQMMRKVKVEESGDTALLPGGLIDIADFEAENLRAIEEGGEPATARPILLGITKASLATDSFLSAASFQETTRVLTEAAIKGKVDPLLGLKENVIIGKLIPAGTGMTRYRNIRLVQTDQLAQEQEEAGIDIEA